MNFFDVSNQKSILFCFAKPVFIMQKHSSLNCQTKLLGTNTDWKIYIYKIYILIIYSCVVFGLGFFF